MKMHANARLSLKGRELLVERVEDRTAQVAVPSPSGGRDGLIDRSSPAVVVANRTDDGRVGVIAALRRLRITGAEIAETLDMPLSTVSGILTRIAMGKLGRLGLEPAQRYERARPSELIHIDVKKLGRIQGGVGKRWRDRKHQHYNPTRTDQAGKRPNTVGWEFVHVCIDDATRQPASRCSTTRKR